MAHMKSKSQRFFFAPRRACGTTAGRLRDGADLLLERIRELQIATYDYDASPISLLAT